MMARSIIPKENPARRNKHDSFVLERREDDDLLGPSLSWTIDWHPETKEWWEEIQRSELALILEPSDWRFLQDTALMHHHVWNNPRVSIAQMTAAMAEIRQRVAKYGATLEDRLKLRMKFADATTKEVEAKVATARKNYREALGADHDS
jgi:hypothetical protein